MGNARLRSASTYPPYPPARQRPRRRVSATRLLPPFEEDANIGPHPRFDEPDAEPYRVESADCYQAVPVDMERQTTSAILRLVIAVTGHGFGCPIERSVVRFRK